jgi:Holliday junction resolvase RusA-like endonuclease
VRLKPEELEKMLRRGNVTVEGYSVKGMLGASAAELMDHVRFKSEDIVLILPYPPSANRYWRVFRGRVCVSQEARDYKKAVGQISLAIGCKPFECEVCCRVDVFRPQKRGDLDNTLKVLLDSLRGIAYKDDKQVAEIHLFRNEDKENPRAEITISRWSPKSK